MTVKINVGVEPVEVPIANVGIVSNSSTTAVQWNTGGDEAWHTLFVNETIKVDFPITVKSEFPAQIIVSEV